jgi:hypothetical protein
MRVSSETFQEVISVTLAERSLYYSHVIHFELQQSPAVILSKPFVLESN